MKTTVQRAFRSILSFTSGCPDISFGGLHSVPLCAHPSLTHFTAFYLHIPQADSQPTTFRDSPAQLPTCKSLTLTHSQASQVAGTAVTGHFYGVAKNRKYAPKN